MKKVLILVTLVIFSGCSKFDNVATVAGVVNNLNPDIKSREALKTYGKVRKEVRDAQEAKKQGVDTLEVSNGL